MQSESIHKYRTPIDLVMRKASAYVAGIFATGMACWNASKVAAAKDVGVTPAMAEGAVIQPELNVSRRGKVKPDAQIFLGTVDFEKPGREKLPVVAVTTCRTMS